MERPDRTWIGRLDRLPLGQGVLTAEKQDSNFINAGVTDHR
jgi:hypothetical protein